MNHQENFYNILGVSSAADLAEIKQAYRKLALKHHPDRNRDNVESSTEIFKRISEAYSVLSDENSRVAYDRRLKDDLMTHVQKDRCFPDEVVISKAERFRQTTSSHDVASSSFRSTPTKLYQPEQMVLSCSFSLNKAHEIFNNFFADFDEFDNGCLRQAKKSPKAENEVVLFSNRGQTNRKYYSERLSPAEKLLYRNLDLRDKYKNSTFNSWKPDGDDSNDSKMPTQFLYFFGSDPEKNKNLKSIHRRRKLI